MASVKSADKIEEGGIFALYSKKLRSDLAGLAYYGMYALQHRGQESAGFSIIDTLTDNETRMKTVKGKGLVADVFSLKDLQSYVGNILIGHLKYATEGGASAHSYQPLRGESLMGKVSIVHNGNLINTEEVKKELLENGSIFQTKTDTEIILKLLGKNAKYGYKEAVLNTLKKIDGAFAIAVIIEDKLIGVRDPLGIRPLCLGETEDGVYALSSESCALDAINAKFIRDIEPGEIVIIDEKGVESIKYDIRDKKSYSSFEYIYFARPDSVIDGINVYSSRHEAGKLLYEQNPIEADIVIGVPDSGVPAAIGYSEASGIPYGAALLKNKYVGRTFILPTQELRETAVRVKLNRTRILFGIIASSTVYVQKVDDAHPVFGKANRSDIILLPGTHKLEINYSSQRIGVFYKTVAQYTEFENIEVTVEEGNEYIIKYNKKEGTYKIDKVEPKKK